MKSNRQNTNVDSVEPTDQLVAQIKKEKEALVSMFLANASITELAAQYRLIDELNSIIQQQKK